MLKNHIGNKFKCLKIDNKGGFCRKNFDHYCSYHGIRRKRIVPCIPQEIIVSQKDEHDNHDSCKEEYEIACKISHTVLCRSVGYFYLVNK